MRHFAAALLLAFAASAFGQADEVAKPDPAVESRLKHCQNQTIADSNAPLALDLRNQIRAQIALGRTDDQIRAYMVERYGDFVLYRPPFKATTAVLWLGPFILIGVGIVIFFAIVRRRRVEVGAEAPPAPSPGRRQEIEKLLE
jgi:cytochrome c-type biogenesis protein CcmH